MQWYGIYLEKYFTQDEVQNLKIAEILKEIGFEMDVVSGDKIDQLTIPVLTKLNGDWAVIRKLNKNKVKIEAFGQNSRMANIKDIKSDLEELYVIKPLPFDY